MAAHTVLGFILAVGLMPFAPRRDGRDGARGALVIWVVCLNGGTLALNSVFDQDEGDIGYLRAPPRAAAAPGRRSPSACWRWGMGLAFTLPSGYALVYAACLVMSLAYSVPPFRFKAVAGVDWVINMWGFGTFTPYAGWAATGRPLDLMHGLVMLAFCPLFASLYPLTQIYQFEEDEARGDRTLALILGLKCEPGGGDRGDGGGVRHLLRRGGPALRGRAAVARPLGRAGGRGCGCWCRGTGSATR